LGIGCGGLAPSQLTASPVRTDGGTDAPGAPNGPGGAGGGAVASTGGAAAGGAPGNDGGAPSSDAGGAACPPAASGPDGGPAFAPATWTPATPVPFPCDPLPTAFYFPHPGADVPGAYARCASFGGGRTTGLAVSADGTRVALIADDGIVRLIDVASHLVVGVLAPPRASIDRAAFSPTGDSIVTLAKGERVVTLWRADTLAPVWSTTLPGHTYFKTYPGGATFSPDGAALLISPGADVFLLDAATGAIRATRNQGISDSSVIAAVYGWNGRRIVVQEAPVSGMCVLGTVAGSVTILDPDTLAEIATPVTWPQLSDEGPPPGQLVVAAAADLMLATGAYPDYGMNAFRISDGTPLAAPNLDAFPALLTPDGTAALVVHGGLSLQSLADGTVIASAAANTSTSTVAAASADGATIAVGSSGDDLLGIWRPATGSYTPTCSSAPSTSPDRWPEVSLSADGQTVAISANAGIRVMRRVDGAIVSTLSQPDGSAASVSLSPDGHYAVAEFLDNGAPYGSAWGLFRTSDGARITSLPCGTAVFSPDETTLAVVCGAGWNSPGTTTRFQVSTGQPLPSACGDPPLAPTLGTAASFDGTALLSSDMGGDALSGSTLWQVVPTRQMIQQYPPRPEESSWKASEIPVAVSTHAERVITGAHEYAACTYTPQFTSRVHDVATNTIVDELPPSPSATSADLSVIAYGPVLWCLR